MSMTLDPRDRQLVALTALIGIVLPSVCRVVANELPEHWIPTQALSSEFLGVGIRDVP